MAAVVVARNILEHGLSPHELINVNVPAVTTGRVRGDRDHAPGRRVYQDELVERVDPRGIPYYWIGGPPPSGIHRPGTDFYAVVNRRIAVTPIHLDLTGRSLLRRMQRMGLDAGTVAAGARQKQPWCRRRGWIARWRPTATRS